MPQLPRGIAKPKWYADNGSAHPGNTFMTRMRRKIHDFVPPGVALALAVSLAGCATAPPPIQLMDRAQSEIRAARGAGAVTTAPEALAEAERRLAAAQQLSASNDNAKAADKAQEAEAAASTARARAEAAKLDQEINRQTAINQSLEADLQRKQEAAAAAQRGAAPASSVGGDRSLDLPPIQLGQPAPASSAAAPAPSTSTDDPDWGVYP